MVAVPSGMTLEDQEPTELANEGSSGPPAPISLDARLLQLETVLIAWALEAANGNKSQAAKLLQIKRSTLGDRIARCRLDSRVGQKSEV